VEVVLAEKRRKKGKLLLVAAGARGACGKRAGNNAAAVQV